MDTQVRGGRGCSDPEWMLSTPSMGLHAEALFASRGDFRTAWGHRAMRSQKINPMAPQCKVETSQIQPPGPHRAARGPAVIVPFTGMKWRRLLGDLPFPDLPLCLLCLRYEEEVSLRATAENEFVALKKVSNVVSRSRDPRGLRMTDCSWKDPGVLNCCECGSGSGLARSGGGFPEIR